LHKRELNLLLKIKSFFDGVGIISNRVERNQAVIYAVTNIDDLINVIIPHFHKFPLLTQKRADFEVFCTAVNLIKDKKHLTMDGICEILQLNSGIGKKFISSPSTDSDKEALISITPTQRTLIPAETSFNPN
jgi:hypothetical protein